MRRFCLLLALLPIASAVVGGYYDYNGFRYQLANSAVDIDTIDFTGDDCSGFPCTPFAVPATCSATFDTSDVAAVAVARAWDTSFLATTDGLYPVTSWMLSPGSITLVDAISVPGSVSLNDAGWQARIILQCRIPCPSGSILIASVCSPCNVGQWSVAGGTVCQACTNAPATSVYTSSGADTSNCSFSCNAGTYVQPFPTPYLWVGDRYSVRAVNNAGVVTTIYQPRLADQTYASTFFVVSQTNKQIAFMGSTSVNRVDLSAGTFSTIAGSTTRGNFDNVGTSATFNSIVAGALWQSEAYLLALDNMNCNLRQVNLATRAVTTVLGSASACSFQDGTGLSGWIRYPTDLVISSANIAYIADAGNYRIRAVVLASMAISTIVGNGVGANTDGVGTAASVDPRYLALSADQTVLYVKTISTLRQIVLSTNQITTLAPFLGASPFQFAVSKLNPNIVFYAAQYSVNSLIVPSGQTTLIAGSGSPSSTDGKGPAAGFLYPNFLVVVNESLTGTTCATCTVCPASQYGVCNSTTSLCLQCPLGKYSSTGALSCLPCPAGTFGASPGACSSCPVGSYSSLASTACLNCSAGAFLSAGVCLNCSAGTYSAGGTTFCSQCTNLVGNATYAPQPGTNATNCPIVCKAGFNFVQASNLCSICAVGQWSPSGATVCFTCTPQPLNSTFSGVGTNATNCPFTCNSGYIVSGSSCAPCPAGTRMLNGLCAACQPASYSASGATSCTACSSGYYSLAGASACTACPNQGPYTVFIGRGTSSACPFYCSAGAYVFNRTSCAPCVNGTFSTAAATGCSNCGLGTWSGTGATACTVCSSLTITAANKTGLMDYPYLSKAGWGVTAVVCNP